jgi:hypothetical protein
MLHKAHDDDDDDALDQSFIPLCMSFFSLCMSFIPLGMSFIPLRNSNLNSHIQSLLNSQTASLEFTNCVS